MAKAPTPVRWYMLSKDGMATLCADKADAEQEAIDAQAAWPGMGPHRAVQLVEAGASLPLPGAQEAVATAYMHDDPGRVDVIHADVKKLLHDSHDAAGYLSRPLDKSARYTIPLYAAPQPALSAGWQPIATHPRHGDDVQLYCADTKEQFVGFLLQGNQFQVAVSRIGAIACVPTHWMPIPTSPSMDGESRG